MYRDFRDLPEVARCFQRVTGEPRISSLSLIFEVLTNTPIRWLADLDLDHTGHGNSVERGAGRLKNRKMLESKAGRLNNFTILKSLQMHNDSDNL